METLEIDKYKKKSLPQLKVLATKVFNAWIRKRDIDLYHCCISCGGQIQQAGHFYSAGHHSSLRYNESNCHGQCVRCNHFLSGNLINYRKGLVSRYGEAYVIKLEDIAAYHTRHGYKWDKFTLIDIIEKYK